MAKRKLDISYLIAPSALQSLQDKKARRANSSSGVEESFRLLNSSTSNLSGREDHRKDKSIPEVKGGARNESVREDEVHMAKGKRTEGETVSEEEAASEGETASTSEATTDEQNPKARDAAEEGALAKRDEAMKAYAVADRDHSSEDDDRTENDDGYAEDGDNSKDGVMEIGPGFANDDEDGPSAQFHGPTDEGQGLQAASTGSSGDAPARHASRPSMQLLAPTSDCKRAQIYFTVAYPSKSGTRRRYRFRIMRTKLASSSGVKTWPKLKQLQTVDHDGERYELGDIVYVYTDENVDSPARIRDMRDTGDGTGRKEICVSWLWSKEETERDCKDTSLWPTGATHTDSNWLQIFPWDRINGRPTRAEVRASPRVTLDACNTQYTLLGSNDPAVRWVFHPQNTLSTDNNGSHLKTDRL
jgi:hypothetical protein